LPGVNTLCLPRYHLWAAVTIAGGLLVACLLAAPAVAQIAEPVAVRDAASEERPERPGLIRAGAWYLTPYIHIGALGIDTNVFYTPTDRQTDFTASGGPGLEIVRPVGEDSRFRLDGAIDYLWFARTESQRRLNGYGSALLDLQGVKTHFVVEERYSSSFSRPNYQVTDRVQQETEETEGALTRRLGDRFQLALFGFRRKTVTDNHDYLGTNLGVTLTEDRYSAGGEVRTALSVKTQLVAGGDHTWYRFPRDFLRNGESTLVYGGVRTDTTALISGQALGGARFFRLDSGGDRTVAYVNVNAAWHGSPKTTIGARLTHDLDYSAFATSGPTPTNVHTMAELYLDKMLSRTIYLRLYGRLGQLQSDGTITIETPDGPETQVRNDRVREAGAELGYQFRTRVRVGVTATYSKRRSDFQDFGVDGLLAGLTVTYNPPQPTFR
jgi:hypothetical protein